MPALDGLRAVAILAVFALHANVKHLPGGGVGVDVFFTLSGYLITALLLAERDRNKRIRLVRFWGRRAQRLLPALLVLIAIVTGVTVLGEAPSSDYAAVPSLLLYCANWFRIAQ